jgi:hypothetical protein
VEKYFVELTPKELNDLLRPHQAVDVEAGVPPGENALGPLQAEKFSADEKGQHLAGEDLGETRVVDPRDLIEPRILSLA